MRVLVIDEKAKEDIARLLKYADENRISKPFLQAAATGKMGAVGDNPQYCCYLQDGFKIVFSIEQQPQGWSNHLSVSVKTTKDKILPSIPAVELILKEFNMKPLDDSYVYFEDTIIPNSVSIISLI